MSKPKNVPHFLLVWIVQYSKENGILDVILICPKSQRDYILVKRREQKNYCKLFGIYWAPHILLSKNVLNDYYV